MAVSPNDLLQSAEAYSFIAKNEADYRGCISRGYYASFHAAKKFHIGLSSPGNQLANCGEHENLLHMLNHPTVDATNKNFDISKEISLYLKKMLFNRRLADYDIDQPVSKKNVEIVFEESKLLFDSVK